MAHVALIQPSYSELSEARRARIKEHVESIMNRRVGEEKVAALYRAMSREYVSFAIYKRDYKARRK